MSDRLNKVRELFDKLWELGDAADAGMTRCLEVVNGPRGDFSNLPERVATLRKVLKEIDSALLLASKLAEGSSPAPKDEV